MTKEQMDKQAYEIMIKNNPDEAIKNLLLKDKCEDRIEKAIKCIIEDYEKYYGDDLLDEYEEIVNILKGDEKMNRTEFIGTNLYYSQEFVDDMKRNYEKEIDRLNKIIDKIEDFIQLKIIRYENEKDYMLEPQDILDIYYHLKKLKEEGK